MNLPKPILLLSMLLLYSFCFAQLNYFNEIGISKNDTLKKGYTLNIPFSFKNQIKTDAKWRQLNLGGELSKPFNSLWKPFVGLSTFYTTQDNNVNYFEVRPYIGIHLFVPTFYLITLQQRFKYEVRKTIFKNKASSTIQNRVRYKLSLNYKLNKKHPEKLNYWSLNTGYEWYFVGKPNAGEQFSANREFHFSATKRTLKNTNFTLNYQYYVLNVFTEERVGQAHTMTFTYNF